MIEEYSPASDFLTWVINEDAPLTGSEYGDANLRKVIKFASDDDKSNRDWATFILANLDLDTPAIRATLVANAEDIDEDVRVEAIQGIVRRDVAVALPYIQRALAASSARISIFEAAAVAADPSLIEVLTAWAHRNADDELIAAALVACKSGVSDIRYR